MHLLRFASYAQAPAPASPLYPGSPNAKADGRAARVAQQTCQLGRGSFVGGKPEKGSSSPAKALARCCCYQGSLAGASALQTPCRATASTPNRADVVEVFMASIVSMVA